STTLLEKLKARIILRDEDGSERKFPSLIECYETYTGFPRFIEFRLEQAEKSNKPISLNNLIGNLRNFTKADSSWYGWLKWKQLNPEYTADRTALPDPNEPTPVTPYYAGEEE